MPPATTRAATTGAATTAEAVTTRAAAPPRRPSRADAGRNYDRLLLEARRAFAELGAEVSLDVIARQAELGSATLYRHFPTRELLLEAVYRSEIEDFHASAADLLARRPPGDALVAWLHSVTDQLAALQGLRRLLVAALSDHGSEPPPWCRTTLEAAAARLLEAAQRSGELRPDLDPTTLLRLVNALAVVGESSAGQARPDRLLPLLIDGLRPRPTAPAAGPPAIQAAIPAARR